MRQPAVELVRKVVIPRDQQDRGPEGRKGELQESVALRLVLDEIAGDENRIRRQKSPARVGDAGLERSAAGARPASIPADPPAGAYP